VRHQFRFVVTSILYMMDRNLPRVKRDSKFVDDVRIGLFSQVLID
jgi:hypothetical protein